MDNIINIRDYNNIKCCIPKSIYSWITIIVSIILIFLIFAFNYDFEFYYNTKATYYKNNSMLKISIPIDDVDEITENNKLILGNMEYEYDVNKITNQLIQGVNMQQYSDILLDLRLDKKYKIENNLLDIKIKYDEKNIFEIIKDFVIGEGN